jgi:hypothetical protein
VSTVEDVRCAETAEQAKIKGATRGSDHKATRVGEQEKGARETVRLVYRKGRENVDVWGELEREEEAQGEGKGKENNGERKERRLCVCACVSIRLRSFPCVCSNVRRVCQGVFSGYVNISCLRVNVTVLYLCRCAKGCGVSKEKGAE